MAKYLIEGPHTSQECATVGPQFAKHPRAKEILDNTYWRCNYGEHMTYTVAEFESEGEAKEILPEPIRGRLTVKPVDVFSYDEAMATHQE